MVPSIRSLRNVAKLENDILNYAANILFFKREAEVEAVQITKSKIPGTCLQINDKKHAE